MGEDAHQPAGLWDVSGQPAGSPPVSFSGITVLFVLNADLNDDLIHVSLRLCPLCRFPQGLYGKICI